MTLQSTVSVQTLSGDGHTREFPFTFKVWENQVRVILTAPDSTQTDVTADSGVDIHELGGVVLYPAAMGRPALQPGYKISILRDMAFTQETDLAEASRYSSTVLENRFDKLTAQDQQLKEELARALRVPVASGLDTDAVIGEVFQARDEAEASASNAASSAGNAADSASASAASASSSSASATASAGSAELARKWAENPVDVPITGTSYSSYHWAKKAQQAASGGMIQAGPAQDGYVPAGGADNNIYGRVGNAYVFGTFPADTGKRGMSRQATAAECNNGSTSGSSPAFVNPEGVKSYIDGRSTAAATAGRLVLRDSAGRAKIADPAVATDIVNKQYVDAAVLGMAARRLWNSGEVPIVLGAFSVASHGISGLDPDKAIIQTALLCVDANAGFARGEYSTAWGISVKDGEVIKPSPFVTDTAVYQYTPTTEGGLFGITRTGGWAAYAVSKWRYIFKLLY